MEMTQVLEQNSRALKQRKAAIRGEIELLKEELIEVDAKLQHNNELLAYMRDQQNVAQNSDTPNPNIEE